MGPHWQTSAQSRVQAVFYFGLLVLFRVLFFPFRRPSLELTPVQLFPPFAVHSRSSLSRRAVNFEGDCPRSSPLSPLPCPRQKKKLRRAFFLRLKIKSPKRISRISPCNFLSNYGVIIQKYNTTLQLFRRTSIL
jgi:hypothetical protein